jgi:hypothetical protein
MSQDTIITNAAETAAKGQIWGAVISLAVGEIFELWKILRQQHGEAVPEWDAIMLRFNAQQAKIDAAKD